MSGNNKQKSENLLLFYLAPVEEWHWGAIMDLALIQN